MHQGCHLIDHTRGSAGSGITSEAPLRAVRFFVGIRCGAISTTLKSIGSGSEVNWLIDGLCRERLPAIDLAHVDLTGGEQRPEQHGRRVCRWQHGLRFDPALELLMQPFDRVRGSRASPLARRQAGEGEQPVAGFLQTVGDRAVLEPPFANEGFAARLDFFRRGRVDHVVIVGGDLLMQALGRVREQIAVLMNSAPLHRHAIPDGGDCFLQARRAIDDEKGRPPQATLDQIVENGAPGFGESPPMFLTASSTFWPSSRTPMTTSSEIDVALRSSRTRTKCRRG